jgi:hypothetical protein
MPIRAPTRLQTAVPPTSGSGAIATGAIMTDVIATYASSARRCGSVGEARQVRARFGVTSPRGGDEGRDAGKPFA